MDQTQKEIEGAAEYLQYHNFKSLMEWMTAEMILSRPEDPFHICLATKVQEFLITFKVVIVAQSSPISIGAIK